VARATFFSPSRPSPFGPDPRLFAHRRQLSRAARRPQDLSRWHVLVAGHQPRSRQCRGRGDAGPTRTPPTSSTWLDKDLKPGATPGHPAPTTIDANASHTMTSRNASRYLQGPQTATPPRLYLDDEGTSTRSRAAPLPADAGLAGRLVYRASYRGTMPKPAVGASPGSCTADHAAGPWRAISPGRSPTSTLPHLHPATASTSPCSPATVATAATWGGYHRHREHPGPTREAEGDEPVFPCLPGPATADTEVLGLDAVKRLSGGIYVHTAAWWPRALRRGSV